MSSMSSVIKKIVIEFERGKAEGNDGVGAFLNKVSAIVSDMSRNELDALLDEQFKMQYPISHDVLSKAVKTCSCKNFEWESHVCPYDVGKNVEPPSTCQCCIACRIRCVNDFRAEQEDA